MIAARYQQPIYLVGHDGRDTPSIAGDHHTAARERLQNGSRHVVDIRRLHVDVSLRVVAPHVRGPDWAHEPDVNAVSQSQARREVPQRCLARSSTHEREGRIWKFPPDRGKSAERAPDVVEILEVSRR